MIEIRAAELADADALWQILEPIIRAGEVFAWSREMSRNEALATWCSPENESFVAVEEGQILGTAYLRKNPLRPSDLCANAGFAVAADAVGRGVATLLCRYTLDRAINLGYQTMQFNYVVSTNKRAVKLWQAFGFEVESVLQSDFNHPTMGRVDVFVMTLHLDAYMRRQASE